MSEAGLGVFGGTFDPIHFGHLRLAEEARQQLGLETVVWIPAGQPRHRDEPEVSARQRLEMVRLAIAGNPKFELDASEVEAEQASYTVPTLERLRGRLGARRPLVLLLGADAFAGLANWHRWRDIFGLAHLAVAHRPGVALELSGLPAELAGEYASRRIAPGQGFTKAPGGTIATFAMTPLAISATQIRQLLAAGDSVRYLLPESVIAYIAQHHLYSRR